MPSQLGKLAAGFTAKLNLLADLALLCVALWAAAYWRGGFDGLLHTELSWFTLGALGTWVIVSSALRHYDPWAQDRDGMDDAAMVSVLVMAVTTLLALVSVALPDGHALPQIPAFLLLLWPTTLTLRLLVFRVVSRNEAPLDDVLVVGVGPMGRATADDIHKKARRRVMGFVRLPDEPKPANLRGQVLGTADALDSILRTVPVAEVYIACNSMKHSEDMQKAIAVCERYGIPFALPAYAFRMERAQLASRRAVSDGYLHFVSLESKPSQMAMKRLVDIVASAVACWGLLPLFAFVAVAIKVTSRGPVFFKQVRVGINGKPFHMLKFRSMVTNAEELKAKLAAQNEQSGPVFKMKNDPRITGIGRFIRKYSIDELPQLINVLRGDMSIVGPRPPVPQEVAKYEAWQRRRLSVRPGLTCIWQVSGRNQITFEQWMYMDMQYIDTWSLAKDFSLIFKTVPVVITGRGAS